MKQWEIAYEFLSRFSAPVSENYYKLRCFPRESQVQRIVSMDFNVETSSWNSMDKDSFGNTYCIGSCMKPHDMFRAVMHAVVERDAEPEPEPLPTVRLGMYRSTSYLTAVGDKLSSFYKHNIKATSKQNTWERARDLMSGISAVFSYESGVTSVRTSAEEAFGLGRGVCQDYAHILIALCRHEGILARYAAGMIPGEGATHAWVEVYSDGFWKGFDPTHNRETDESYITFSVGLDAGMCALNRGVFKRGTELDQEVHAAMHEGNSSAFNVIKLKP